MRRKFKHSGQYLTELALCLAIMSAAILAMRIYAQRAFQARYKDGPDYLFSRIEEATHQTNLRRQYDPYYQESFTQETKEANITRGFPDFSLNQTTTRSGWQRVGVPGSSD